MSNYEKHLTDEELKSLACCSLLPPPGGEVVIENLRVIGALREETATLRDDVEELRQEMANEADAANQEICALEDEVERLGALSESLLDSLGDSEYNNMGYTDEVYDLCDALECALAGESAALERIAELEGTTWCAYCGEEFNLESVEAEQIGEHIHRCPKHPIAVYRAEVARLRGLLVEIHDSVPATYDDKDPMVIRHARALNEIRATLNPPDSQPDQSST